MKKTVQNLTGGVVQLVEHAPPKLEGWRFNSRL